MPEPQASSPPSAVLVAALHGYSGLGPLVPGTASLHPLPCSGWRTRPKGHAGDVPLGTFPQPARVLRRCLRCSSSPEDSGPAWAWPAGWPGGHPQVPCRGVTHGADPLVLPPLALLTLQGSAPSLFWEGHRYSGDRGWALGMPLAKDTHPIPAVHQDTAAAGLVGTPRTSFSPWCPWGQHA